MVGGSKITRLRGKRCEGVMDRAIHGRCPANLDHLFERRENLSACRGRFPNQRLEAAEPISPTQHLDLVEIGIGIPLQQFDDVGL